jgi:hypothetical protein
MLNDLFKKNSVKNFNQNISVDDFLDDEIKIEIERNQVVPDEPEVLQNIDSNCLMRDYKDIKILSMNPQIKEKIIDLIKKSKEDLQKIDRILNNF